MEIQYKSKPLIREMFNEIERKYLKTYASVHMGEYDFNRILPNVVVTKFRGNISGTPVRDESVVKYYYAGIEFDSLEDVSEGYYKEMGQYKTNMKIVDRDSPRMLILEVPDDLDVEAIRYCELYSSIFELERMTFISELEDVYDKILKVYTRYVLKESKTDITSLTLRDSQSLMVLIGKILLEESPLD